ncbi:hypothetical protein GCM10027425_09210 [Alteromonas gracilis]
MGILQRLNPFTTSAAVDLAPVGTVASAENVVRTLDPDAALAFGISSGTKVTRKEAMRVPAIGRGRNLIAGTIGTLPLVTTHRYRNGQTDTLLNPLTEDLDPRTTPAYTLTWTVDDLMFGPVAWWRVTGRHASGPRRGYPSSVERIAPERVSVIGNTVRIDGQRVDDADLIRFDGPDEGLLERGSDVVRLWHALQGAARRNADDDVPTFLLSLVQGAPELTKAQVTDLLNEWEAARRQRRTAFMNGAIEGNAVNFDAQKRQLTELGQWASSELARLINLPASRIGAPQGSGMTYANTEADRRDLVDNTLSLYTTPIFQRLSMPDVTPPSEAVRFDFTAYLRGDLPSTVKAGSEAITAGIADAEEVRTGWLQMPPRPTTPTPDQEAAQ